MVDLADAVLPLIRTRSDLHRRGSNAHGRQMHAAVDELERTVGREDPQLVWSVTQKALASAISVIARADDSSGIIGDAVQRLLELHPRAAAAARVPASRIVDWMIDFQFHGKVDYFTLDVVTYAPALGTAGLVAYRARLDEITAGLREPAGSAPRRGHGSGYNGEDRHAEFVLGWNARRLAVLDRDVTAVIRTHARDRKVAAWLEDTARALAEIDQIDLAIDWAHKASEHEPSHQALHAAGYWCELLAEHQPEQLLAARLSVFERWPSASTAAYLHRDAADHWPAHEDQVMDRLADSPRDAVLFALLTLSDIALAWQLAHTLGLELDRHHDVWDRLVDDYETLDPIAVLPALTELADQQLTHTGAQHYRNAARYLQRARRLAAGTTHADALDNHISQLRLTHRHRPRLHTEFDHARLP